MGQLKMNSIDDQGTFNGIMKKITPDLQAVALELRALMAEIYPGVTEVSWEKQRNSGYGVGPKKMSEQFCYIAPQKKHVNLGFYYGADLSDPTGLLEGSGKSLRHVKIHSVADAKNPNLKKIVKQASQHLPKLK